MIILKEKVAWYNNTLTLATKEMKFGVNEEVNKVTLQSGGNTRESRGSGETTQEVPETGTIGKVYETTTSNETLYLLGTATTLGFIVARYVI